MALYEYRCPKCGVVSEVILKPEDREKQRIRCPKCRVKMELIPYSKVAPFRWGKGGGWNG